MSAVVGELLAVGAVCVNHMWLPRQPGLSTRQPGGSSSTNRIPNFYRPPRRSVIRFRAEPSHSSASEGLTTVTILSTVAMTMLELPRSASHLAPTSLHRKSIARFVAGALAKETTGESRRLSAKLLRVLCLWFVSLRPNGTPWPGRGALPRGLSVAMVRWAVMSTGG